MQHRTGLYNLCFIKKANEILMLKRKKSPNRGKLNGVGGKIHIDELPELSMIREIHEETGLIANSLVLKGVLRFIDMEQEKKDYLVYTYFCEDFSGELLSDCDEGELLWIPQDKLLTENVVGNIPIFYPRLVSARGVLTMNFYHYDSQGKIQCHFIEDGKEKRFWHDTEIA
jgi:8-oxo-dGTP diphosphatase